MASIGVKKGRLRKLSISVSEEATDWIESQVLNWKYRSISDAIETLIREKMASNETPK